MTVPPLYDRAPSDFEFLLPVVTITNLNRYSPIDKTVEEKSKSGDCECESWWAQSSTSVNRTK